LFGFSFQLSAFGLLHFISWLAQLQSQLSGCSVSASAFGLLGFDRPRSLTCLVSFFGFLSFNSRFAPLQLQQLGLLVSASLVTSASQLVPLPSLFTACSTSRLVYNLLPASACSLACIRSLRPVHKLGFPLGFASACSLAHSTSRLVYNMLDFTACLQRAQLLGLFTIFSASRHSFHGHCAVGGEATP